MADKFQHRGIEIELTTSGEFFAVVNGKNTRKPSLKAMKEFIDEAAKTAFEPFNVLIARSWKFENEKLIPGTDLIRVKAIAIEKTKGRFVRRLNDFTVQIGDITEFMQGQACYRDEADAIKAYQAVQKHEEETRRIRNERQIALEQLQKKLKQFEINPDLYAKKK